MHRILPLALLVLAGCMSRPGVVDCTTGRAYPGFSKPLCGGPFDPFVWLAGDCETCCANCMECAYTPYGGRTWHGEPMQYTPSCIAPPLKWAPPAIPHGPGVHGAITPPPPHASAPPLPEQPPVTLDPDEPDPQNESPMDDDRPDDSEPAPHLDARLNIPGQSRR